MCLSLLNEITMKVLVATEKPFAAAAVNGIKAEVEAAGNEWKRGHKCPERLFDKKTEELISNAVDLGNWATIETYDPLGGFDF